MSSKTAPQQWPAAVRSKDLHRAAHAILDPAGMQILLAGEAAAARNAVTINRLEAPDMTSSV